MVAPIPGRSSERGGRRRAGATYEIVLGQHVGVAVKRSFEDLDVRSGDADTTVLTGWFPDQAALHGVLRRIQEHGLDLWSVRRLPG